jgi:hypothetical protein
MYNAITLYLSAFCVRLHSLDHLVVGWFLWMLNIVRQLASRARLDNRLAHNTSTNQLQSSPYTFASYFIQYVRYPISSTRKANAE